MTDKILINSLVRRVAHLSPQAMRLVYLVFVCHVGLSCLSPVPSHSICFESTVDRLQILLAQHSDIPSHLETPNPVKTETDFDLSKLFQILDRVGVKQGYRLDYVYFFTLRGASRPELYARRADEAPYYHYRDYFENTGDAIESSIGHPLCPPWLRTVETDGSSEGYFQLFTLVWMGSNFYRSEGYRDYPRIVSHPHALHSLLQNQNKENADAEKAVTLHDIRISDIMPRVDMGKDRATVKVVVFNQGQLERIEWTVTKSLPHAVTEIKRGKLSSAQTRVLRFPTGNKAKTIRMRTDPLAKEEIKGQVASQEISTNYDDILKDYNCRIIQNADSLKYPLEAHYFLRGKQSFQAQPRLIFVSINKATGETSVHSVLLNRYLSF